MTLRNVPKDQQILDEYFSLVTKPGAEKTAWLFGMVAVYGKTPDQLKGFKWNDDHSITLKDKKRPLHPLHPQWAFLFQLKEKQPFKKKDCWLALSHSLAQAQHQGLVLNTDSLLLAHKVRKVYYTPIKRRLTNDCQKKQSFARRKQLSFDLCPV